MLLEIVAKNRSYRRFHQEIVVERAVLEDLVNLARLSASAGNLQPLKYFLSCDANTNSLIFENLKWAAYLRDWDGPGEGEKPPAYIVVLGDNATGGFHQVDAGIACQSILLGATEAGLGGCILASINRENLRKSINISSQYEILYVIALGKPAETVVVETAKDDIKYWRDSNGTHHVPKRPLSDLLYNPK